MKKCAAVLACLLLLFCVSAPCAFAGYDLPDDVSVSAASAYFVNLDTGIPVFERNADEERSVASLTKLMTALLLIENVPDLTGTVIEAERSLYTPLITQSHTSHADILPGSVVDAQSMLYAILLPSANEAAEAVGYYLGNGNLDNFYALMNARAAQLGCTHTSFTSTNGLRDKADGNYSTAHDIFLIFRECWKHDIFRTVVSTTTYNMPTGGENGAPFRHHKEPYPVFNTNALIRPASDVYRPYIAGGKTGSSEDAGRCLASAAVNERGETYLGVTLGSTWEPDSVTGLSVSFYDTASIYDWLFDSYSVRPSIDTASPVSEIHVDFSAGTDTVMLYPADDLKTVLPNDSDELLEKTFDLPESIPAPVHAGDSVGSVTLTLNGDPVGTVELIAGEEIERSTVLYVMFHIKSFFKSLYFRVVCIVTAVFLAGYGILTFALYRRAQKQRAARRRRKSPLPSPQQRPESQTARQPGQRAQDRRPQEFEFYDDDFPFVPPRRP